MIFGRKVCFKYDDYQKKTIVSKIADNLNFQKTIYIHIDDKEFPNGSVEKKAKLFGYGFGSIFLVIGIVCIMSLF